MSDEFDLGAGLEVLEAMRLRVSHEREIVESALANLYERLGVDDPDVVRVDEVCSSWHVGLLALFDVLTASGLKRGDWNPPG